MRFRPELEIGCLVPKVLGHYHYACPGGYIPRLPRSAAIRNTMHPSRLFRLVTTLSSDFLASKTNTVLQFGGLAAAMWPCGGQDAFLLGISPANS